MQHRASPQALHRFRIGFALVALALLAVPLVAMQFSRDEVDWTLGDFVVAAMMLSALGVAIEIAIRFAPGRTVRAGAIALALAGFLFVWAGLAVG